MPLEQLAAPPIDEVYCGIFHDPVPGLDPISTGLYWHERRELYPRRELHPAVSDDTQFILSGVPNMRAWLLSADGVFLVQIQQDRFYFNWRVRQAGQPYPRFNDHNGAPGILSRSLDEYRRYAEFCRREFGVTLVPRGIELSKIDLLVSGQHWNGFRDLAEMLPWLRPFAAFSGENTAQGPIIAVRFVEPRAGGDLNVGIDPVVRPGTDAPTVRLETRIRRPVAAGDDLEQQFRHANDELNDVFEKLVPREQRDRRFQGGHR